MRCSRKLRVAGYANIEEKRTMAGSADLEAYLGGLEQQNPPRTVKEFLNL